MNIDLLTLIGLNNTYYWHIITRTYAVYIESNWTEVTVFYTDSFDLRVWQSVLVVGLFAKESEMKRLAQVLLLGEWHGNLSRLSQYAISLLLLLSISLSHESVYMWKWLSWVSVYLYWIQWLTDTHGLNICNENEGEKEKKVRTQVGNWVSLFLLLFYSITNV